MVDIWWYWWSYK